MRATGSQAMMARYICWGTIHPPAMVQAGLLVRQFCASVVFVSVVRSTLFMLVPFAIFGQLPVSSRKRAASVAASYTPLPALLVEVVATCVQSPVLRDMRRTPLRVID